MKKLLDKYNALNGFSLVELIVVIVILAILVGVTIGGVTVYVGQSRVNTDINNAASIQSALATMATDEDLYKAARSFKSTLTLEWGTTGTIPAASSAETFKAKVIELMGDLLPDGVPSSKTGDGFQLTIQGKADGDVVVICHSGAEFNSDSDTTNDVTYNSAAPAWK